MIFHNVSMISPIVGWCWVCEHLPMMAMVSPPCQEDGSKSEDAGFSIVGSPFQIITRFMAYRDHSGMVGNACWVQKTTMIRNVRGNNGMMTASSIAVAIVRCWAVDDLSDMIWVRLSTPKMDPFLIHDYIAPKMVNTSKLRCFPEKKNIETYRNYVGIWQYLGLGGTRLDQKILQNILIPVPRNRGRSPKSAHETKRSHWVANGMRTANGFVDVKFHWVGKKEKVAGKVPILAMKSQVSCWFVFI